MLPKKINYYFRVLQPNFEKENILYNHLRCGLFADWFPFQFCNTIIYKRLVRNLEQAKF
ncbi:MAG: hypothetical protein ACJAZR_000031 [Sediminicola sp.]|jgi:hypothetical protein